MQNLAFAVSTEHDVLVFNYADFIWGDGSLSAAVAAVRNDADAVLTFCLPVERRSTTRALNYFHKHGKVSLSVPPRALAEMAIGHLHRDARAHFWDAPNFAARPTYLLWQVAKQGILIRAYHQTVLALRVKHDAPDFRFGITRGGLDGYYSARLASTGRIIHANDSDHILVVSLYDAPYRAVADPGTRKQALQHVLEHMIDLGQRRFAEIPIRIKAAWTNSTAWAQVKQHSLELVRSLDATTLFSADAFERGNREVKYANRASHGRSAAGWIYQTMVLRLAHSTVGVTIRRGLGGSARAMRLRIERWIYGNKD